LTLVDRGAIDDARAEMAAAVEITRATRDRFLVHTVIWNVGQFYDQLGEPAVGAELIGGEGLSLARELGVLIAPLAGWTVAEVAVNDGRSVVIFNHDQAGPSAVVLRLTAACDPAGAVQAPSPAPGVRRYQRAGPRTGEFAATWYDLFPGGCLTYQLHSTSDVKGSFTGAVRDHQGLFQAADGGTLLLDEIGDMPMRLQVKLLRVLQENNIRPIGATDAIPVNVRVISATHRDLQQLMMSGQFREDLYYRLNVVHIEMPPLNRRREDIPLLVSHFLAQISNESGVRKIYAPEAVELLATADWPGNIRQLANVVRQNVALSQTPIIPVELVQQSLGCTQSKLPSFDEARDEFTRSYLSQILQITGGNVSQAARLAKRNRTDFYKLLSRHQLTPEDFKGR